MKTLLAGAFGAAFVTTAAVCALASEPAPAPRVTVYAGPASMVLPASALATAPVTADIKPSLTTDQPDQRQSVRVVLASPYPTR